MLFDHYFGEMFKKTLEQNAIFTRLRHTFYPRKRDKAQILLILCTTSGISPRFSESNQPTIFIRTGDTGDRFVARDLVGQLPAVNRGGPQPDHRTLRVRLGRPVRHRDRVQRGL